MLKAGGENEKVFTETFYLKAITQFKMTALST
jgi:hypothetical protein